MCLNKTMPIYVPYMKSYFYDLIIDKNLLPTILDRVRNSNNETKYYELRFE